MKHASTLPFIIPAWDCNQGRFCGYAAYRTAVSACSLPGVVISPPWADIKQVLVNKSPSIEGFRGEGERVTMSKSGGVRGVGTEHKCQLILTK